MHTRRREVGRRVASTRTIPIFGKVRSGTSVDNSSPAIGASPTYWGRRSGCICGRFIIRSVHLFFVGLTARFLGPPLFRRQPRASLLFCVTLVVLRHCLLLMYEEHPSDISSKPSIDTLKWLGYSSRPRSVGYYFDTEGRIKGHQRLNEPNNRHPSGRQVSRTERETESHEQLGDSKLYRRAQAEPFENAHCRAQHEWQLLSYPTCNCVHEMDIGDLRSNDQDGGERARILAWGYWRDVWKVRSFTGHEQVLKSMRYQHDFWARNYDRHRRDALASERLTWSPNVVDIYSFCGNSGVFEYGSGGDINNAVWPSEADRTLSRIDKLKIAVQVSMGIADAHDADRSGHPSIAHTDISPGQFIFINGTYKLNDFNRCRFIRWNRTADEPCPYRVGNNPGKLRSPEEYEYREQTELVDVYSMGNIFYILLTELWPFQGMRDENVTNLIKDGQRPIINASILNSTDLIDVALQHAIQMTWSQDPSVRSSAAEVQAFLSHELNNQLELRVDDKGNSLTASTT